MAAQDVNSILNIIDNTIAGMRPAEARDFLDDLIVHIQDLETQLEEEEEEEEEDDKEGSD